MKIKLLVATLACLAIGACSKTESTTVEEKSTTETTVPADQTAPATTPAPTEPSNPPAQDTQPGPGASNEATQQPLITANGDDSHSTDDKKATEATSTDAKNSNAPAPEAQPED